MNQSLDEIRSTKNFGLIFLSLINYYFFMVLFMGWSLYALKKMLTVNRSPRPEAPVVNELFELYSTVYVFFRTNNFQTQAFAGSYM